ncbi:hypothetical protein R6Z07M_018369 [Ovis aries]
MGKPTESAPGLPGLPGPPRDPLRQAVEIRCSPNKQIPVRDQTLPPALEGRVSAPGHLGSPANVFVLPLLDPNHRAFQLCLRPIHKSVSCLMSSIIAQGFPGGAVLRDPATPAAKSSVQEVAAGPGQAPSPAAPGSPHAAWVPALAAPGPSRGRGRGRCGPRAGRGMGGARCGFRYVTGKSPYDPSARCSDRRAASPRPADPRCSGCIAELPRSADSRLQRCLEGGLVGAPSRAPRGSRQILKLSVPFS